MAELVKTPPTTTRTSKAGGRERSTAAGAQGGEGTRLRPAQRPAAAPPPGRKAGAGTGSGRRRRAEEGGALRGYLWFALIPRGNLKLSHSWHSSRLQRGLTQGLRTGALAARTSAPPASAHLYYRTDLKPNSVCARRQPRAAAVRKVPGSPGSARGQRGRFPAAPRHRGLSGLFWNSELARTSLSGSGKGRRCTLSRIDPWRLSSPGSPAVCALEGFVGPALRPTGAGGGTEDRCLGV